MKRTRRKMGYKISYFYPTYANYANYQPFTRKIAIREYQFYLRFPFKIFKFIKQIKQPDKHYCRSAGPFILLSVHEVQFTWFEAQTLSIWLTRIRFLATGSSRGRRKRRNGAKTNHQFGWDGKTVNMARNTEVIRTRWWQTDDNTERRQVGWRWAYKQIYRWHCGWK